MKAHLIGVMGDKQSQKGGDSSQLIQAGRDIHYGLSYESARQVFMDLYRANFLDLAGEAADIAYERAERLIESFLTRMAQEGKEEIPEAKNPDFQYVLYQAQKDYARTGSQDLGNLLVQLLVDRAEKRTEDLMRITLNEALAVVPKLTPDQLDTLSIVFVITSTHRSSMTSLSDLHEFLDELILPFVPGATKKRSGYQHLAFARCASYSPLLGGHDLASHFVEDYPSLFCTGFTEDELDAVGLTQEAKTHLIIPCLHNPSLLQVSPLDNTLDDVCNAIGVEPEKCEKLRQLQEQKVIGETAVKDYLVSVRPQMQELFEIWNRHMKSMELTSVGVAIAHANIKRKLGLDLDLYIWI